MKIIELLEWLLKSTDDHRYAFISGDPFKLHSVTQHLLTSVYLGGSTTLHLVMPSGMNELKGAFDGVFCDEGVTVDPAEAHFSLKPGGFLKHVDERGFVDG
jgi:hypothetical protein